MVMYSGGGESLKDALTRLYPSHMASLKRQEKAHERRVQREKDLEGLKRPITKKAEKAIKANERRNAERKARHLKYAQKI